MPGTKSHNPFRPRAHRYALEPRQMYDGAALVEAAHHVDPAHAGQDAGRFVSPASEQPGHATPAPAPTPPPAPSVPPPTEVYVVDQSVANWQSLVSQLPKGSQVVVLDDKTSGLTQIADALRGEHDVAAIHILSHGASDSISLGSDTVTAANVAAYTSQLHDIGAALGEHGDILLYGCDVSSHDTALVTQLGRLTQADIASSTDATGAAALGGDWVLESHVGQIETRALTLNYDGLLAAPTVDTTSKGITVAEPSSLNAAGADRATLSGWSIVDDAVGGDSITVKAVVGDTSKGSLVSPSGGTAIAGGFTFTGTRAQASAWLNQLTFVAADVELGNTAARTTIDVTVTDAQSLSASRSLDVTITPSNDPVAVPDATKTVVEVDGNGHASVTTIGTDTLAAVDPEVTAGTQTPTQIVYSLTALPQYGYLILNGNRLGAGSVFTQQDVIDGRLSYVHTATGADQDTSDGFDARVNDGATPLDKSATVHVTLNVQPVNQAPTIGGEGMVYEGQPRNAVDTGNVGQYIVASTGGDPQDTALTVTITSLPTHGTLYYNGVAVTVGQTFDYANRNLLTYSNDGVDGIAQDSFGVRVNDLGGGTGTPGSADGTITLDIHAVDDDPSLDAGSTRTATVTAPGNGPAGAYSVVLTPGMIGASDVDSPDQNISFVTSQAGLMHGYLLLNGEQLKDGATFTMADVTAGRVQYVQTAGATAGQQDTFHFQVVDNTMALRWNADGTTFTRIGGDYTGGARTDTLRDYTFTIDLAPTANGNGGSFPVHDPVTAENGSTFAGVDPSGHALGVIPEGGNIVIHGTTTNGQPTDFTTLPGLSYTAQGVDPAQVVYTFLGFTNDGVAGSAGTLQKQVNGNWVDVATYGTFTQADLDAGRVRFQHDGASENFHVTANFSVSAGLLTVQNGQAVADSWTPSFDIYVTPENDAPTVTGSSSTVINEGEIAYITKGQLGIADPDDATSQGYLEGSPTLAGGGNNYAYNNDATGTNALKFLITSLPPGGTLQYSTDGGAHWQDVTVNTLLDASIVTGSAGTTGLRFVSNGSEVRTASFTVAAQDRWGQRSTSDGTVTIQITNVNDAPQIAKDPTQADPGVPSDSPNNIGGAPVNEPLTVPEGGYAQISTAMLQAYDPDSSAEQVQYTITSAPAHGNIAYSTDGGATFHILGKGSSFTQADVAAGRIYYLNDGTEATGVSYPSTPDDRFGFTLSDGDKEQTGNEFWIYTDPTNDAPTVTAPTGPINLGGVDAQHNPVPGFSVADPDLTAGVGGGEADFVQVTVRLLNPNGSAFTAADYANDGVAIGIANGSGATMDADKDGNGDFLVLRGTRAQVNAALAGLTVNFAGDRDATYQVQVIADDRLRDGNGNLTSGANGGSVNQSATPGSGTGTSTRPVDTTNYDWYNDAVPANTGNLAAAAVVVRASNVNEPGTLTGPASGTVYEDQPTYIGGGFVVADPESAAFDTPVTVTLSVPSGFLGIGGNGAQTSATASAAGSRAVTITGDNTGTLVLTGRASDIQALLNDGSKGLTYQSAANVNHDLNGAAAGDVTLTLHFDDAGSRIGDDSGSGSVANNPPDIQVALDIVAVNDAPTVSAGSGTVYLNGNTAVGGFSVGDVDYTDGGGITTGEQDFMQVTVRVTDANGVPLSQAAYANIVLGSSNSGTAGAAIDGTYDGTDAALVIRGTRAQVNAYLAGLQVSIGGSLANADQSYRVQVIADDRLRDANGNLDGSGAANGGLNPKTGGGTQNVPTTAIDPYAAVPGGLTQDVASAYRVVFPSSVNNPTAIGVTAPNAADEGAAGVYTLSHVTLADPDAGTAPITATVTLPTGFSVHDVNGVAGSSGTFGGATYTVGTDGQGRTTITINGTVGQVEAAINAIGVQLPNAEAGDNNAFWNGTFQVQVAVNDNGNHGGRPDRPTLDADGADNVSADPSTAGDHYGYADGDGGTSNALVTTRVFDVTISSRTQVSEAGLADASGSQGVDGTASLALFNDLDSVTIGNPAGGPGHAITLTLAQLRDLANVPVAQRTVVTDHGTLVVTGYIPGTDDAHGTLVYHYSLSGPVNQPGATASSETIAIATRDSESFTDSGSITVNIVDDVPVAHADTGDVNEDGPSLSGNVVSGDAGGGQADHVGADVTATPVSGVVAGTAGGPVSGNVGAGVTGQYGTLTLHADGSYGYQLDNGNKTVNALKDGETLTDVYTYTITDADGDTSTTTLTITIHGHTDGAPAITPHDGNGPGNSAESTGHTTVWESGLTPDGPLGHDHVSTDTIAISAPDGLVSIVVGGTTLTTAQLNALSSGSPVVVTTPNGTLSLTGFTPSGFVGGVPTGGTLTYTYTLTAPVDQAGADHSTDAIALSVTDAGGSTANGTLMVDIVNDAPTARADQADVNEDGTAIAGNVVTGGAAGLVADRIGADGTATPVSGVAAGTAAGPVAGNVGAGIAGQYGTLTLNADGSYGYVLDNANATVNALRDGQTLTDVYTYTITDADGDTSTTTLTITIHGHTDGGPSVTPVDGNGAVAGHATVAEAGLVDRDGSQVATGTIELTADDGLASITVGGTTVTAAQLAALNSGSTVSIATPQGTLVLTGFQPSRSVGGVPTAGMLSYTYTLDHAVNQPGSTDSVDPIALTVTDAGGGSANGTLVVDIVDDVPTARDDSNTITENDATVTGSVLDNDRVGADATSTPVSGVGFGGANGSVGAPLDGKYGALTLNADGSYSYALNNDNPVVNALKDGQTLTETYTYVITDADGDSATATLTITIRGMTDGDPVIVPGGSEGAVGGHDEVGEPGLVDGSGSQTTKGHIDLGALDGLANVNVGGMTLTPEQLANLSPEHPMTVRTPDGTLVLTGFTPTDMVDGVPAAGRLDYTYTLDHAVQQTGPVSNDTIHLGITDVTGAVSTGTLVVQIANDVPTAHDDSATIVQDAGQTGAGGNVFTGSGVNHDGADRIGADGPANGGPLTAVVSSNTGHAGTIGGGSRGEYGTLVLNADGSYSYQLDKSNPKVSALDASRTLTEVFVYTITDADGDTSEARLTITIHGTTPPMQARWGDQIFPIAYEHTTRDIRQGYVPGLFVLPEVSESQSETLRWQNQWVSGRGDVTAGTDAIAQDPSNTQFVLRDGVAFSRQVLVEAQARARVALNDFGLASSPLWDDFSPFAPSQIGEREAYSRSAPERAHVPAGHAHERDHETTPAAQGREPATHAAHPATHAVTVTTQMPPPASTPVGAPSLTAQIAAMAKAGAVPLASAPANTQPRH